MPHKSPDEWEPVGIEDLEPVAWDALRHEGSSYIVAGPGAGKTEFLAQRACYLLDTGTCPSPRRILAISFKRDAATNLAKRVKSRASEDSSRFVSMTFDAFTKGIVDRFRASLPEYWQLRGSYEIDFPRRDAVVGFLNDLGGMSRAWRNDLYGIRRETFLSTVLGSYRLPLELEPAASAEEFAVLKWWEQEYVTSDVQHVDFIMLNRLAELVIRANPHIQRALRLTYPFVFVDEFQDTTFAQYSFLRAVFGDERTVVTAVGDNKQRIMGWAGALDDAFTEFRADFDAEPFELEWNFRSSDELIAVQHVFAQALDIASKRAVSKTTATVDDDAAAIWHFNSEEDEAHFIAEWIAVDSVRFERSPSDYALLARQKTRDFEDLFASELARVGIRLRNDDLDVGKLKLQDLLVDELAVLLIGVTRLAAATGGNGSTWTHVSNTIAGLRGADDHDDNSSRVVNDELSACIKRLRRWMKDCPPSRDSANELARKLMQFVDVAAVRRSFLSHRTGDAVTIAVDAFRIRMAQVLGGDTPTWAQVCDYFEGRDAVRLMTVHKSKGLEYHTVFFLCIDDNQWWSHRRERQESTSTFFVGLSRAEQRTIFTYCDRRAGRATIADLYLLLDEAGVPEHHF